MSTPSGPVRVALLGAGNRGTRYTDWILEHPDRATVLAVAEPDEQRRTSLADDHHIDQVRRFADWQDLLADPALLTELDAVLVCTQDRMHTAPATAALRAGLHVMLEKPMAPTQAECDALAAESRRAGRMLAVCHVLRYTPYTKLLVRVIASGVLGALHSVQHTEPIGWWHFAHSYVRGHWRNEEVSSSMLLAKSCHDIDWLEHVMGEPITTVSSFGRLSHFRPENRPEGAAGRCLDCRHADTCPYSATKVYVDLLDSGHTEWPLTTVVHRPTADEEGRGRLLEALRTGPYGRCAYDCDNDVVDHQVVACEFASGATGTFTVTGFSQMAYRRTSLFGSHGEAYGDGDKVVVVDFRTGREERFDVTEEIGGASAAGGHGGGDEGLVAAFVEAVATGDPSPVLSDAETSRHSHAAVFAAETARREGSVVRLRTAGPDPQR